MPTSIALLLFFAIAAGNFAGMIALSALVGPKRPNLVKDEPFECGSIPLAPQPGRLHVRFYRLAMLFIVFDIETVLLYPWAVIARPELGRLGLAEMGLFVLVLAIGLAYVWKRGGLEWD
jgi:NADH-quinone oxidoreductase subunit A